jgi:cytochrome oxidase Cu insertion factor (SCO1/SenC/PrrC family)
MTNALAVFRRPILLSALLIFLAGGLAAGWIWYLLRVRYSGIDQGTLEGLQVFSTLPEFTLIAQDGRRVITSDLLGKVWVANFIYTHCTDTCPLQSARMAGLQTDFSKERDLQFISITVDPSRDTPAVLTRYAARFGADLNTWWFLTGNKEAIYALIREGFHLSVEDPGDTAAPRVGSRGSRPRDEGRPIEAAARAVLGLFRATPAFAHSDSDFLAPPFLHSSWFILGDRQARIRGYYRTEDEQSLKGLRRDIRTLL